MTNWKPNKWTNQTDKVMTNEQVAIQCIDILKPYFSSLDTFLEPCMWEGSFYNNLPKNKDWCEITKWKDFFEYNNKIDWIITNPPYSIYEEFLDHCFEVSNNVAFIIPLAKPFSSLWRINKLKNYWWITKIWVFPYSASKAGFPFWFPLSLVWYQKWYKWTQEIVFL